MSWTGQPRVRSDSLISRGGAARVKSGGGDSSAGCVVAGEGTQPNLTLSLYIRMDARARHDGKEVLMDAVKIDDVLRLQDFGLERLDEAEAIVVFAKRAEARIARWLDFAKGALLMLMVSDDPESGCLYIYDRSREAFYSLALPIEGRFGGFREDEFDGLCQAFGLKALASNPRPLRA